MPTRHDRYYEILEISSGSSECEIKQSYKRLANLYHPDKDGGNADKFREICNAYHALTKNSKTEKVKSSHDVTVYRISLTLEECYNGTTVIIEGAPTQIPPCRDGTIIKTKVNGHRTIIVIDQKDHTAYISKGLDIVMKLSISAIDAMIGYTLNFKYLDGEYYSQKIEPPIAHGKIVRVMNKGLTDSTTGNTGVLYIVFDIYIPTLTDQEKLDIVRAIKHQ